MLPRVREFYGLEKLWEDVSAAGRRVGVRGRARCSRAASVRASARAARFQLFCDARSHPLRWVRACRSGSRRPTRTTRAGMRSDDAQSTSKNSRSDESRPMKKTPRSSASATTTWSRLDERGKSLTTLELAKWLRRAPAGRAQPLLRHRRPDGLGPEILKKASAALVAVGADLPARHGAGDTRRTAVSRALGAAESPLPSRVTSRLEGWPDKEQEPRTPVLQARLGIAAPPPVVRRSSACRTWSRRPTSTKRRAPAKRRRIRAAARAREGRGDLGTATRTCRCSRRTPPW